MADRRFRKGDVVKVRTVLLTDQMDMTNRYWIARLLGEEAEVLHVGTGDYPILVRVTGGPGLPAGFGRQASCRPQDLDLVSAAE